MILKNTLIDYFIYIFINKFVVLNKCIKFYSYFNFYFCKILKLINIFIFLIILFITLFKF